MSAEQEIPTPWIGTEDLPVHFANAFGAAAGPNAIFLLFGSVVPPAPELPTAAGPYVPVRPIVRLAIAPAAISQLMELLDQARAQQVAEAEPEAER
jgi:hypothetical protein